MRWRETAFDGYFVSDTGLVKGPTGKLLTTNKNNKGYLTVCIKNKQRLVHRLVAFAFLPCDISKPQVNHIDGNKENNDLSNLEWCTQSYNMKHAFLVLKRHIGNFTKGNYDSKGIKKYNDARKEKVVCLDTGKCFESVRDAERKTKIHAASISRCVSGKQKSAGGYRWALLGLVLLCGCVNTTPAQTVVSCVDMTTYVNNAKTAAQVISRERLCEMARTGQ